MERGSHGVPISPSHPGGGRQGGLIETPFCRFTGGRLSSILVMRFRWAAGFKSMWVGYLTALWFGAGGLWTRC
jgi:hypothetical protein